RMPEGPASEVDVGELLAELARTSLPAGMSARVHVAPGTPRILGRYDPLRRAFANLLRNAAEAMNGTGAVEVDVAPAPEGGVNVRLRDHGPGVDPGLRERIFDPYVTTKAEGTGLGLALVRQTVDAHGGRIRLEDTTGGGATFVVHLPRGPAA
ncbi:MAG TPA: ATP-binding protein, partial [Gemmatimonadales bacterium]|nr:ATP-binding protein [Gemmatimonadales bacterium]